MCGLQQYGHLKNSCPFFLFLFSLFCNCTVRQRWSTAHNFGGYSLFNSTFICFKDTSSYDHFSLFNSVFLCFSLVTVNRQTSYDPGILRQCYGNVSQFVLGFERKMVRDLIVLVPDHCLSLNFLHKEIYIFLRQEETGMNAMNS